MSNFLSLNTQDFLKGLVVAVFSAVLLTLQQTYANGGNISMIDWNMVLNMAIGSAIAYLVKNLLTTSDGKTLGIFGGQK